MHNGIQSNLNFDFEGYWIYYIIDNSLFHLVLFITILIVAYAKDRFHKKRFNFIGKSLKIGAFVLALLFVGGFFNSLWNLFVLDKIYTSNDVDADSQFSTMVPFSQRMLIEGRGSILTGSFGHLQLIWFSFATMSWMMAFGLYRLGLFVMRSLCGEKKVNSTRQP